MDPAAARELLDLKIDCVSHIIRADFGVNHVEATLFEIVALLKNEPALRAHFLERTRQSLAVASPGLIDDGTMPTELLELVVHELRWPEFAVLAEERVRTRFGGNAALAISDVSCHLSQAYGRAWSGRVFYSRFQGNVQ